MGSWKNELPKPPHAIKGWWNLGEVFCCMIRAFFGVRTDFPSGVRTTVFVFEQFSGVRTIVFVFEQSFSCSNDFCYVRTYVYIFFVLEQTTTQ